MRDEWFSDHLDLSKWAVVHRLASTHGLQKIAHVAFYTASRIPTIFLEGKSDHIDHVVWSYFRDFKRMEREALGDLHIRIFDRSWPDSTRATYWEDAIQWLLEEERPQLVILDPDTGLEPAGGANRSHVFCQEVADIWARLRPRDILALFQHAPRGQGNWIETLLNTRYRSLAKLMGKDVRFQIGHRQQDHPKAAIFWTQKSGSLGLTHPLASICGSDQ